MFPLFATGLVYIDDAGANDTGGEFATSIVDTVGKFAIKSLKQKIS